MTETPMQWYVEHSGWGWALFVRVAGAAVKVSVWYPTKEALLTAVTAAADRAV